MFTLVFTAMGGYRLFDFQEHFWAASISCAAVISIIAYAFKKQNDKIEKLKERTKLLEETVQEMRDIS